MEAGLPVQLASHCKCSVQLSAPCALAYLDFRCTSAVWSTSAFHLFGTAAISLSFFLPIGH